MGRLVSDSALTSCINAARSAIGDSGEVQRLIKTLPREGVRFVGTVREENSPAAPAPPSAAPASSGAALALTDKPSVAVLPFANLSDDSEQQYFADGLAEDIITRLGRLRWLFVSARNSSFSYKGKPVDVSQVGRELGVRYVLGGSVRRSGQRLRISAELSEASTGSADLGRAIRRRPRRFFHPSGPDCRKRHRRDRAAALCGGAPALPEPIAGQPRRVGLRHAGDAPGMGLGISAGDRDRPGFVETSHRHRSRLSPRRQSARVDDSRARSTWTLPMRGTSSELLARWHSEPSSEIPMIPGPISRRAMCT